MIDMWYFGEKFKFFKFVRNELGGGVESIVFRIRKRGSLRIRGWIRIICNYEYKEVLL